MSLMTVSGGRGSVFVSVYVVLNLNTSCGWCEVSSSSSRPRPRSLRPSTGGRAGREDHCLTRHQPSQHQGERSPERREESSTKVGATWK